MKRDCLVYVVVSVAIGFVAQTSLFRYIRVGGSSPDLLGILAVSFGLLWGPSTGLLCGALGGIAADVWNGRFIGIMALTRGCMGFGAGLASRSVFKENLLMTGVIGFATTLAADLIGAAILRLHGLNFAPQAFVATALRAALLNMFATPLVFYVLWREKVRIDSRHSQVIVE